MDSALNNILLRSTDDIAPNFDSKQQEPAQSYSHPSDNEQNSDKSHEGQPPKLHKEERPESANVDVTEQQKQQMKLKGDETDDDDASWKQWKEQRRKMDSHKEPHHKTTDTSSQEISDETTTDSQHLQPRTAVDESVNEDEDDVDDKSVRGTESIHGGGSDNSENNDIDVDMSIHSTESIHGSLSQHETAVNGSFPTINIILDDVEEDDEDRLVEADDDILDKQSVGEDSDVNAMQTVQDTSSAAGSNVRDRDQDDSTETDIPESPDVKNPASTDDADHDSFQNVGNEELLKTERNDEPVTFEPTAESEESENKQELLVSEDDDSKETFHDNSGSRAENTPELAEILQKSSADCDEDEVQGAKISEAESDDEDAELADILHKSPADDGEDELPGVSKSDAESDEEDRELADILHKSSADHGEAEMQAAWASEADSDEEATAPDAETHETTNTEDDETFDSEEHSDTAAGSDVISDDLPYSEDVSPVHDDVSDTGPTDVSDDGNPGWTFSPLGPIYSFIDAIIDMVRNKAF